MKTVFPPAFFTAFILVLVGLLWGAPVFAAGLPLRVEILLEKGSTEMDNNVRQSLSIERQKDHELMNEGRLRRLHAKASSEIIQALQPFGFYRVKVDATLSKQPDGQWLARYRIHPGDAIRVAAFDLQVSESAQADEAFNELLDNLPLKKGDVFVHGQYESIKSSLMSVAAARGYFEAAFKRHAVEVDLKAYAARIQLEFDAGPRYRYGDIQVTEGLLGDGLVKGYLSVKSGDEYLTDELVATRQALGDSDYFQSVEVSHGIPDPATQTVPVNVELKKRGDNRYLLGLGYGTDTGSRLRLGWEKPMINEKGHRFASELKVSEIGSSISANYSLPVLDPRTDRLVHSAGISEENTDSNRSRVQTIGTTLNRSQGKWREALSIQYQQENFTVADVSETSRLFIPGASWTRTWGSRRVLVFDGVRLDIGLQGASKQVASDANFVQSQLGLKFIQSLGEDYRVLARGRVGATLTQDFDVLPSSVRFFAGGAQSVRGYAYEALGPVNANGDVEGGRNLLVGSVELERNLGGNWGIAAFYDAGNALDDFNDALEHGAGFGLRWKSPIGPVRIDIANAVSQPDRPWRLHINIGPDL